MKVVSSFDRRLFQQSPTLFGRSSLLLLGLLGLLQRSQLGLMHLLQSVPLLAVVQQAVQHGRDLHVEPAELLQERPQASEIKVLVG